MKNLEVMRLLVVVAICAVFAQLGACAATVRAAESDQVSEDDRAARRRVVKKRRSKTVVVPSKVIIWKDGKRRLFLKQKITVIPQFPKFPRPSPPPVSSGCNLTCALLITGGILLTGAAITTGILWPRDEVHTRGPPPRYAW